MLDKIQIGLDVIGLIPVIGEVADGANAIVSAVKGDWLGAGLSAVSMIPIVGDAIGKGGKAINYADEVADGLKYADDALETMHMLPNQFANDFANAGIHDLEGYTVTMTQAEHHLVAGKGLHTNHNIVGVNWNAEWKKFFGTFDGTPGVSDVEGKLGQMIDQYGLWPDPNGIVRVPRTFGRVRP